MRKLAAVIIALLAAAPALALENLDEMETRASRKSTNAFYSGEGSSNSYIWQPSSVIYSDGVTGQEVTLLFQSPAVEVFTAGTEYGAQWWSADGKRISYNIDLDVGSYTRSSDSYQPWFVSKSDGSYARPLSESPNRTHVRQPYFDWSPTEPDTAYHVGYNSSGVTGKDTNGVYKVSVTDTGGSHALWVDIIGGDTSTALHGAYKNAITPDGRLFVTSTYAENLPMYIVSLEGQANVLNFNLPTLDTYWGNTVATDTHFHDEWFLGNSTNGYWLHFYTSGEDTHWRMRPWSTADNTAAPTHTADTTDPYLWYSGTAAQKEVQFVAPSRSTANLASHMVDTENCNDSTWHYASHNAPDRYDSMHAISDTECYSTPRFSIVSLDNALQIASTNQHSPSYAAWSGWTDYAVNVNNDGTTSILSIGGTYKRVAHLHAGGEGDAVSPSQSPDGTKIGVRSDWLNPANVQQAFVAVAYYPYPPEVRSAAKVGDNVAISFDFGELSGTPRTYSTRGWPNLASDPPPSPREIKQFRLWTSPDNVAWTPRGTVSYGNVAGAWTDNTWSVQYAQPVGTTMYYGVTSNEHSGLESRTLSNRWKVILDGGGSITTSESAGAYPASPGAGSTFYTTAPGAPASQSYAYCTGAACAAKSPAPTVDNGSYLVSWTEPADTSLVRYYNVYANDGSAPLAGAAVDRIASIAKGNCSAGSCSWVDWLGNTNGTTQYAVTTVDFLGNESGAGAGLDNVPSSFTFADQTGVALSTVTTSAGITVAGIDAGQTPAITISGSGCTYNIDGGAYTADAGTAGLDNVVTARVTSSGSYSTTSNCVVTIGGVSDTWSVTTLAAAADPVAPRMTGSIAGSWK